MDVFPPEIIFRILFFIDYEELCKIATVSRTFSGVTNDTRLLKKVLKRCDPRLFQIVNFAPSLWGSISHTKILFASVQTLMKKRLEEKRKQNQLPEDDDEKGISILITTENDIYLDELISAVVDLMKANKEHLPLQIGFCYILRRVCYSECLLDIGDSSHCGDLVIKRGGLDLILETLKANATSGDLVSSAYFALGNILMFLSDENQFKKLMDGDEITNAVSGMLTHESHEGVQSSIANFFACFARFNVANATKLMNQNVIEIIINSLKKYSKEANNERPVRNLIFALSQFTFNNQTRKHLETQEGIFELIITAMNNSWNDRVRSFGWMLLENCATTPKVLLDIIKAGGLNTIFRTISEKNNGDPNLPIPQELITKLELYSKDETIKADRSMLDEKYKQFLFAVEKQIKNKTTFPLIVGLKKAFETTS